MRGCLAAGALLLLLPAAAARGQTVLERTPNVRGTWTLAPGAPVFIFSHRFEVLSGGDELINIPTLTLAAGLPLRLTGGLSYTSNSEVNPDKVAGNEVELWLRAPLLHRPRAGVSAMLAYNSAAESVDGAVSGRARLGRVSLLGELRGFSDGFGSGEAEAGYTAGAMLHLTPYLALQGDVGGSSGPSGDAVWSAGVGVEIPGTPHSFSLYATNGGAATLQGLSQRKVIGPKDVRWGFEFIVPLGTRRQWGRVFRRGETPPAAAEAGATVALRQVAFQPAEIRIRRGQTVTWVNGDPMEHTVDADDGRWGSGLLPEGGRFVRRFEEAGTYSYHCTPHPQMQGVVVVE